jgi:hypothetical protein
MIRLERNGQLRRAGLMGRRDIEEKPGQGTNELKHSKEVKFPSGADACFAAVARFTHTSTKLRPPQDNLLKRQDDQSPLIFFFFGYR